VFWGRWWSVGGIARERRGRVSVVEFTVHETEGGVKRDAMSGPLNPGVVEFEPWNAEHDRIAMEFSNVEGQ
jgi:hypothetical protein